LPIHKRSSRSTGKEHLDSTAAAAYISKCSLIEVEPEEIHDTRENGSPLTKPGGRILITDDGTGELAKTLRDLGLSDVSVLRLVFPVRLVDARKE